MSCGVSNASFCSFHNIEELPPTSISKLKRHSSSNRSGEECEALVKYTSLKDVILNSLRNNSPGSSRLRRPRPAAEGDLASLRTDRSMFRWPQ